jgi:membrane protein implicated in regulation of membrane protease activity
VFAVPDGAAAVYLTCFLLGLLFICISAALGLAHDVIHIPSLHHAGGVDAGGHGGSEAGAHAQPSAGLDHGSAGSTHSGDTATRQSSGASPLNLMTIMAFLTWFGGAGYILYAILGWLLPFSLIGAVAAGFVAGWLVYLFLVKILLPGTAEPDPQAFQVVGSLARVSRTIPAGGSGEVVYTLGGARHSDGARAVDGQSITHGEEVVIVRLERGIAYVEPWTEYGQLVDPVDPHEPTPGP